MGYDEMEARGISDHPYQTYFRRSTKEFGIFDLVVPGPRRENIHTDRGPRVDVREVQIDRLRWMHTETDGNWKRCPKEWGLKF